METQTVKQVTYADVIAFIYNCRNNGTLLDIADHAINRDMNVRVSGDLDKVIAQAIAPNAPRWS